jgi:putative transposase
MKKRFTEEQIINALSELSAGKSVKELGRKMGVTSQTLYSWKRKYGDMDASEARKLKALEQENARLKRIVADLSLDNLMLKDVNSKKW